MAHDASNPPAWNVYKPDGSLLSVTGTTTQGLQEAINYAQQHAYPLIVRGGGITPPGHGSSDLSQILCSTSVAFPTGWNNYYEFNNVNLVYSGTASNDFITFDSSDLTTVDFHDSQIIYPGTKAAVHFNPQHDNGESFAGFTSNTFRLGHIVPVVSTTNYAPDPTKGIGVQISAPALSLGLTNGNGIFVNNDIVVNEINGGLVGIQIDNPGGSGSTFQTNRITSPAIHQNNSVSVLVGTSSSIPVNTIYGNHWDLIVQPGSAGTGVSTWGGANFGGNNTQGDTFSVTVSNGTTGVLCNSTSFGNLFTAPMVSVGGSRFTNNGDGSNRFQDSTVNRVVPSVSASPYAFRNLTGRPMSVFVSGNNITSVGMSMDGTNYDTDGTAPFPQNTRFYLLPGMYLKITYTGTAPFVAQYY